MTMSSTTISIVDGVQVAGHPPLEVEPDAILSDPDIRNLRTWDGATVQELGIPELARLILEEGQLVPCLVRETPDGLMMVAGERRREAVKLIRESEEGQEHYPLKIQIIEADDDQALRAALIENIQRANFTAIELAHVIKRLRGRFHWEGVAGTREVAQYLGVSSATVTQTEKLLTLPDELQAAVQQRRMSGTAALDLLSTPGPLQPVVAAKAQELADSDKAVKEAKKRKHKPAPAQPAPPEAHDPEFQKAEEERARREAEIGVEMAEEVPEITPLPPMYLPPAAPPAPPPAPAPVEQKHIRQAQKQTAGALPSGITRAPKMAEAVALVEQWQSGYPKVMQRFASVWTAWARGQQSDEAVEQAWKNIAVALADLSVTSSTRRDDGKPGVRKTGKAAGKPVKKAGKVSKAVAAKGKK